MNEPSQSTIISVLYVDDEQANLDAFLSSFRREFKIFTANGGAKAKEILSKEEIHVIVTDQRMPEVLGTELLEYAVRNYPMQSRILLTAYTDVEALISAINKGRIFSFHKKPWEEAELIETIKEAHEVYRIKVEKEKIIKDLNETNNRLEEILKSRLKEL